MSLPGGAPAIGGGRARVKSVEQSIADTDEPGTRLRKELGVLDLVGFGVAAVVGAGIFTLTASTAGNVALLVVVVGVGYVKAANYSPFIPPPAHGSTSDHEGSWLHQTLLESMWSSGVSSYGVAGLLAAASLVFFAFLGFDALATSAEEARNPQKDIPRGIIGALVPVTILYVAVSLVLTGMVNYTKLATRPDGTTATLATAFALDGINWAVVVISLGALAGLTTVVLVAMFGQIRVLFAMARDGLLPRGLAKTGYREVPVRITVIVGAVVAVVAALLPAGNLEEMVNIGTLFAFVLVSIGVVVLRRSRPDLPRAFRTPLMPIIPILAVLSCLWLMVNLSIETWLRFVVWMVVGLAIYWGYGRRHSRFARL